MTTPGVSQRATGPTGEIHWRAVGASPTDTVLLVGVLTGLCLTLGVGLLHVLPRPLDILVIAPFVLALLPVVVRWARWRRLGLDIDATGLTLGGRAAYSPNQAPARITGATFHAPWSAVYDARLVTDPGALKAMADVAWVNPRGGTSAGPARPGYFPARRPTLVFRVDLRQAQWPPLPPGLVLSHVWAVPVRDADAVRQLFAAHGVVLRDHAGAVAPTPRWAVVDPVESTVASAGARGGYAPSRNFAEYEAEAVLRHGAPLLIDVDGVAPRG